MELIDRGKPDSAPTGKSISMPTMLKEEDGTMDPEDELSGNQARTRKKPSSRRRNQPILTLKIGVYLILLAIVFVYVGIPRVKAKEVSQQHVRRELSLSANPVLLQIGKYCHNTDPASITYEGGGFTQ